MAHIESSRLSSNRNNFLPYQVQVHVLSCKESFFRLFTIDESHKKKRKALKSYDNYIVNTNKKEKKSVARWRESKISISCKQYNQLIHFFVFGIVQYFKKHNNEWASTRIYVYCLFNFNNQLNLNKFLQMADIKVCQWIMNRFIWYIFPFKANN